MSEKQIPKAEDIIYSQEVIEFTAAANEFCKLLENLSAQSRNEFIQNTYKLASLLLSKTILLPYINSVTEFESETFVNEADWHFIDNAVSEKLGPFEHFCELRDPGNPDTSSEITLSECFADTYQDLKDFTQIFQFGHPEAIAQALTECKKSFENYWGPKLIIIINEFHVLIYSEKDLDEDSNEVNPDTSEQKDNWLDNIFDE